MRAVHDEQLPHQRPIFHHQVRIVFIYGNSVVTRAATHRSRVKLHPVPLEYSSAMLIYTRPGLGANIQIALFIIRRRFGLIPQNHRHSHTLGQKYRYSWSGFVFLKRLNGLFTQNDSYRCSQQVKQLSRFLVCHKQLLNVIFSHGTIKSEAQNDKICCTGSVTTS